jgi:tRNA threonylcarbamoyladenosine biosynthesis protein TsaB
VHRTDEVILLALETSGKSGSVALLKDGKCDATDLVWLDAGSGSAKTLAPAIDRLMKRHSVTMDQLSAIGLLTGPGSFTGLRVGVATAKAMGYALGIPAVEIDTLDVIANQSTSEFPELHVVIDAYRGQVFHGYFRPERVGETRILNIEPMLESLLSAACHVPIDFCGPGCSRIRKHIQEFITTGLGKAILERIRWHEGAESIPRADTVARLALEKLRRGEVTDPFRLSPHYYRGSAAEEKLQRTST